MLEGNGNLTNECCLPCNHGVGPRTLLTRPRGQRQRKRGVTTQRGGMRRVGLWLPGTRHSGRGHPRHHCLGLNVQIPVHLVGAPAANEADAIAVDSVTHHGHDAAGGGGPGRDAVGG